MKEIAIERIAHSWNTPGGAWLILKQKGAARRLFICIGQPEAWAIVMGLQNQKMPRPWTHDLLVTFVETFGGTTKRVVLTELKQEENTFYSKIVVGINDATHEIDARPSDALALAVRQQVPIFAEEPLLQWAAEQDNSKLGELSTLWSLKEADLPKPKRGKVSRKRP
jgi:bifunctional DNase/RNase